MKLLLSFLVLWIPFLRSHERKAPDFLASNKLQKCKNETSLGILGCDSLAFDCAACPENSLSCGGGLCVDFIYRQYCYDCAEGYYPTHIETCEICLGASYLYEAVNTAGHNCLIFPYLNYNLTTQTCVDCGNGQGFANSTCVECSPNCESCSENACHICKEGYCLSGTQCIECVYNHCLDGHYELGSACLNPKILLIIGLPLLLLLTFILCYCCIFLKPKDGNAEEELELLKYPESPKDQELIIDSSKQGSTECFNTGNSKKHSKTHDGALQKPMNENTPHEPLKPTPYQKPKELYNAPVKIDPKDIYENPLLIDPETKDYVPFPEEEYQKFKDQILKYLEELPQEKEEYQYLPPEIKNLLKKNDENDNFGEGFGFEKQYPEGQFFENSFEDSEEEEAEEEEEKDSHYQDDNHLSAIQEAISKDNEESKHNADSFVVNKQPESLDYQNLPNGFIGSSQEEKPQFSGAKDTKKPSMQQANLANEYALPSFENQSNQYKIPTYFGSKLEDKPCASSYTQKSDIWSQSSNFGYSSQQNQYNYPNQQPDHKFNNIIGLEQQHPFHSSKYTNIHPLQQPISASLNLNEPSAQKLNFPYSSSNYQQYAQTSQDKPQTPQQQPQTSQPTLSKTKKSYLAGGTEASFSVLDVDRTHQLKISLLNKTIKKLYKTIRVASKRGSDFILVYHQQLLVDQRKKVKEYGIKKGCRIIIIPKVTGGWALLLEDQISKIKDIGELTLFKNYLISISNPDELAAVWASAEKIGIASKTKDDFFKKCLVIQLIAFYIYTTNLIYSKINSDMRGDKDISHWALFLKVFIQGCRSLDNHEGTVYRGIQNFKKIDDFKPGQPTCFKQISSCSLDRNVAQGFSNDQGMIFEIDVIRGAKVKGVSAFNLEDEVIITPYTNLKVLEVIDNDSGPAVVKLKEIDTVRNLRIILWIGGDYHTRMLIKGFEQHGFQVVYCPATEDANEWIQIYQWVVLLDKECFKIIIDLQSKDKSLANYKPVMNFIYQLRSAFNYSNQVLALAWGKEKFKEMLEGAGLGSNVIVKIVTEAASMKEIEKYIYGEKTETSLRMLGHPTPNFMTTFIRSCIYRKNCSAIANHFPELVIYDQKNWENSQPN